jgi:hypothetical protein
MFQLRGIALIAAMMTNYGFAFAEDTRSAKAHKATLVERTGFAESDPRIEQGAWRQAV